MSRGGDNPVQMVASLLDSLLQGASLDVTKSIVELRASPEIQEELNALASRANEGLLSGEEQQRHHDYIEAIDLIALIQAKARSAMKRHEAA